MHLGRGFYVKRRAFSHNAAFTTASVLPPVMVTGRNENSFLSDFAQTAFWETSFLPVVQSILLSPHYWDNVEADRFPVTGHQQRQLHPILI